MSKRGYRGHTHGPGGLKCPCCGGEPSRKVRKTEKREAAKEIEEQVQQLQYDVKHLEQHSIEQHGLLSRTITMEEK